MSLFDHLHQRSFLSIELFIEILTPLKKKQLFDLTLNIKIFKLVHARKSITYCLENHQVKINFQIHVEPITTLSRVIVKNMTFNSFGCFKVAVCKCSRNILRFQTNHCGWSIASANGKYMIPSLQLLKSFQFFWNFWVSWNFLCFSFFAVL